MEQPLSLLNELFPFLSGLGILKVLIPLAIILIVVVLVVQKSRIGASKNQAPPAESIQGKYHRTDLLTQNEQKAFKLLLALCKQNNLLCFVKVRLADLVKPNGGKEYQRHFNYIRAKHVDFVICGADATVKCILELDDGSHDRPERQERDKLVDEILEDTGYTLHHIRGTNEAEYLTIFAGLTAAGKEQ